MNLETRKQEVKLAPRTVDFNVIGACNLDCVWCWGPDHLIKHSLSANEWIKIAEQLKQNGTENIVITGGEPLMRKDILEILIGLKTLGLRITLSTNAMLLFVDRNKSVLDYVDEIGIPLDGSTSFMNSEMRQGSSKSYDAAIQAIKYVQEHYKHIKLTIRTVLTNKNKEDIFEIPSILKQNQIDLSKARWKIYRVVATGVRKFRVMLEGDIWLIDKINAKEIVSKLQVENPDVQITFQDDTDKLRRYLHIDPTGEIFTLVGDGTEEKMVGHVKENGVITDIKKSLQNLQDPNLRINDQKHGSDNF